jgi:UDP-N-acetylmuramoylalanine--D-glutamate ligase
MSLLERGDHVAVLGLGASGTAAARLARELGGIVYASDASAAPETLAAAEGLRHEGIDAEAGGHDLDRILAARLVVTSPGIDPATEVRRTVTDAGLRTIAEVELAFRGLRSRVIGITGTNGKTTATALCGHILAESGVSVMTAGNIGRPLSEVALMPEQPDWVVVELSSFQLADLESFRTTIGILLNLAPDHLDRYASLERYYADKARLFSNADPSSRWVLNSDDPAVLELAADVPGERYLVSVEGVTASGAFVDEHGWLTQSLGGKVERWIHADELRLFGRHNWSNSLHAGLGAALAGCSAEAIGRGLASFEGLPHRLKSVREVDGVLWVNDSKATNISATRVALEAFDRPLVVLLGGRHKGEPYTALLPAAGGVRAIVAYGESASIIVDELESHVELVVADGFEEAVNKARSLARRGDVVLLSPACSSYDMFPGYTVRGDRFEELVNGIPETEIKT